MLFRWRYRSGTHGREIKLDELYVLGPSRILRLLIPDKVVENSSIIANMMLDITENNDNFKVDEELKDQFELKPLSEFEKLMELEREAVAEAVSELLAEVF